MEQHDRIKIKNGKKYFFRFTAGQRIQHIIMASSVVVLALTGMPLKFHDQPWAKHLYTLFGGIHSAPVVHKVAGVTLLLLFVYHLVYLSHNIYTRQIVPMREKEGLGLGKLIKLILTQPFVPNMKDLKDIIGLLKYLFFLADERPDGTQWTWKEKFDYWGPFWGVPVLGLSGLIMWNKELATTFLPGTIIDFALIAHSDEALLATLFIFIWHWYNVHFSTSVFPMGTVFLTGYLQEELMVEEHYEYYVELMTNAGLEQEICPRHGVTVHDTIQGGSAA